MDVLSDKGLMYATLACPESRSLAGIGFSIFAILPAEQ